MQPIKKLLELLENNTSSENYLYSLQDLRCLFPELSETSFKTLLSRAVKKNSLERICRSLYGYKPEKYSGGLILFNAANHLRSNEFNYISLETALSDIGVISQIPINYITIMTSGRSNKISCGKFGTIEFVHTEQKPNNLSKELSYDLKHKLWRASLKLAIRDMKRTNRNMDLIDWDLVNELI